MATASNYHEKESISCPLCYQPYDDPMLLTCSHIICNTCVTHLKKRGKLKCPDCKTIMDVSDIKVEQTLRLALDTLETVQEEASGVLGAGAKGFFCSECGEDIHSWYCKECDVSLCEECCGKHEKKERDGERKHTLQSTKVFACFFFLSCQKYQSVWCCFR